MKRVVTCVFLLCFGFAVRSADASTIQIFSAAELTGAVTFVDFESALPVGVTTNGSTTPESWGNAVWTPGNDGMGIFPPSSLTFNFSTPIFGIGFNFGNDDLCCASVGTPAVLTIFDGAVNLGSVTVTANMNDSADQYIGLISDVGFTSAQYSIGTDLARYVDNLSYQTTPSSVPEPSSLLLMGSSALVLFLRRKPAQK